jgi:hypothetical protein
MSMWQVPFPAYLGGVTADEVVHGLLLREATHRGQHPKRIAAQQDEVLRVGAHAGDARVLNVMNGVRRACVLSHRTASQDT